MSDRKLSRADVVHGFPIKTMAELRSVIAEDPGIGSRQKEAMRSAIKCLCEWLHKEPENMPADYKLIQRELARLNPVLCGVSRGRFANVRSLVNRSFLAFRRDLVDTRKAPLLPAWQSLFDAIRDPKVKHACGRFARWCSTKQLVPQQVDQVLADAYGVDLAERMCAARPRQKYVRMCRTWNDAAARHPARWPQVRLDPGDRRKTYTLPRDQIHAGFHTDL